MGSNICDNAYMSICSEKTLQSNEQGFFMSFVENVTALAGENWINNTFGKLKSDSDRIRAIYESEVTKDAICSVLSNVEQVYRKKNAEVSQTRRNEAEKAFKGGNNLKALTLYSQSVIRAPKTGEFPKVDNGLSYALALWGRALVLMAMKKYRLAIGDIQLSIKEGLPNEVKPKAYWKLAFCYQVIGEHNSAKQSFDIAEKLTENKDELEQLKKDFEAAVTDELNLEKVVPSVSGHTHPDFPNATKKMKVNQSKDLGRYVVATEPIKTGETIVVEPPYAACLLQEAFGTHCHHCFERLVAPVGCQDCSSVAFCKEECKEAALASYHKYECKILDLLIGSGMSVLSHVALRMITQQSLDRSLSIYKDRSQEKVYSLCTNSEKRKPKDFLQRTLMAAFMLRCLQRSGYFKSLNRDGSSVIPIDEEYNIGELLLFHLQMLQFNAHEIYETRFIPERRYIGSKAAYIGVAVYPTVALFNHDCYSAVTRYFVGKTIVINTTRPLNPEDVIAENYGPVFTRMTLPERQNSLQGRYWFDCKCAACEQNWPPLKNGLDNVTKRIRCPTDKCSALFTLPASSNTLTCPVCNQNVDISEQIKILESCEEQYKGASDMLKNKETDKAIQTLCEAIDKFHRISAPPHKDTHLAQELLRACYADSGNTAEIITS